MVPRTFPSTYQTANGETRMVVFFLSSVSGLRKWVDYIPVKFTMLETQVNNSYNNNGVILVDPLSSTTNRQAWVDYVPVFVDANDTAAWRVDANGFIPVGFSTKPTLNLDFANTKTLDSRITFTRASNATYFDANGVMQTAGNGVARFDHNPITGESLGLLVEEQRTNLFLRSEEFDNAYWTKSESTITANTVVAPDETLSGDKLVDNTNGPSVSHYVQRAVTVTSGIAHAFSVYVKAAEETFVQLLIAQGSSPFTNHGRAIYNLSNGTVESTATGTASITPVGNGWYRCVIVGTTSSTTELCRISISKQTSPDYTGNGFNGIYIWGAQFEVGAFPTSYIPTVAATVTRNADVASMTGTNFSSWYRADEGSVYAEYAKGNNATSGRVATISNGTTSNQIRFGVSISTATRPDWQVITNGATEANVLGPEITINAFAKVAGVYKVNDIQSAVNGTARTADTSAIIPIVNQIHIGINESNAGSLNGTIKKLSFYPVRLSNAQLQALTR